jgi:prolyl-tRNA synthetase
VVLKRRDTGTKEIIPQAQLAARLPEVRDRMQNDLYAAAKQRLKDNRVLANSVEEVEDILREVSAEKGCGRFVIAHVKDDPSGDARMKEVQGYGAVQPQTGRIRRLGRIRMAAGHGRQPFPDYRR